MIIKTVSGDKKPVVCSENQMEIYKQKAEAFDIQDIMRNQNLLSQCIANMQNANRRSMLEMTIIKVCSPELCDDIESLEKRVRALELGTPKKPATASAPKEEKEQKVKTKPAKAEVLDEEIPLPEEIPTQAEDMLPASETHNEKGDTPVAQWSEILKILSKTSPLIHGVLNGSQAFISGQFLLIDAPNTAFRNLVNGSNATYRDAIRKAAEQVLGQTYKLGPYKPKQVDSSKDPLKALAEKLKQFDIPNN
jgi:DNA polymerase-3 subunit gamma/tau